jgi:hypothetical protein
MHTELFGTACADTVRVARTVSFPVLFNGEVSVGTTVQKNSCTTEGHPLYDCLPSIRGN